MKLLTITFTPCTPTPENGYNIQYRVVGSSGGYIDAGNFTESPIYIIVDTDDADHFEGLITSDCGSGVISEEIAFDSTP